MTWIWVLVLVALVLIAVAVPMSLPLRIPREPDREGLQDAEASEAYDRTSRWPIFAIERSIILKRLDRLQPKGRLLDIGCGPGYLAAAISRRFPNLKVMGLDISPDMVSIAKRNWAGPRGDNLDFVQGDVVALPFPDNSIDLVVSSLSLHHWKDPVVVFREIHRVIVPGGTMLVMDPRRDAPRMVMWTFRIGQALFAPKAIRRTNGAVGSLWASYTASELQKMLAFVPFERLQVGSSIAWLLVHAVKSSR